MAQELKDLAQQTRGNYPRMKLLSTFTITNLGMYGVDDFTPIINQPESAILGVGVIKEPGSCRWYCSRTPNDDLKPSFDHRLVDGSVAAVFGSSA